MIGLTITPYNAMIADINTNPSQADKVLAKLKETPGEWVEMPELARACGGFAVHSRISELRHKRGLTIEHKEESIKGSRQRASFYRLIP